MAQPSQLLHGLGGVRAARQGQGGAHAAAQAVEVRGLGLQVLAFFGGKDGKIMGGLWENIGKSWETTWENHRKMWESHGTTPIQMDRNGGVEK